jgi:deoxycytidylate deaminase
MRYLLDEEALQAERYIAQAALIALQSTCYRSRCGTVIVKENKVIGAGFNSPPANQLLQICRKDSLPQDFRSDKTCCIHAELRALFSCKEDITGSTLYFIRLDEHGEQKLSGKPYCTMCSKAALDAGVKTFVLKHAEGIAAYDTVEYNEISFGLHVAL